MRWISLSNRGRALLCVAVVLLSGGRAARGEMQVEGVLWGFDGQVTPYRFVPLSIQVSNPTSTPFDGTLRLVKRVGESPAGAPHEQAVYLSPFSSRWVQFYPYVKRDWDQWVLTWDDGRQRHELPQPPFRTTREMDEPTVVLLTDAQDVAAARGAVKNFPDHLFPPMVTATDALDVVLLDHVPRWQEARREAFLDWLARGGTLHLLDGPDGQPPDFPAEMDPLNNPTDRFHYGAGTVFRQRRSRGEVGAEFLDEVVRRETARAVRRPKSATEEAREVVRREDGYEVGDAMLLDDFAAGVFQDLRGMTLPRHPWLLLYLLSVVYVGVVFPGCYLVGRRTGRVRPVYVLLLGGIALFSVAFSLLGRRGPGERSGVECLALARPLRDKHWDVTGWAAAFVTAGDQYRIAHHGTGGLYATCQDIERVNGILRNGPEGAFEVDIPGHSSRQFAFRVKATPPPLPVRVETWETSDGQLTALTLSVGKNFPPPQDLHLAAGADDSLPPLVGPGGLPPGWRPENSEPVEYSLRVFRSSYLAVHGDGIYPLTRDGDRLVLDRDGGVPVWYFVRVLESPQFWHYAFPEVWGTQRKTDALVYARMVPPLVTQDLGLDNIRKTDAFRLPPDRLRLYVYAPLPAELSLTDPRLPQRGGYVLYSLDLFEPAGRAGG